MESRRGCCVVGIYSRPRAYVQWPNRRRIDAKSIYFEQTSGELAALDEVAKQLKDWKRLKIVDSRDEADLVATISSTPTGDAVAVPTGGIVVAVQSEAFVFSLRSAKNNQPLWSDREAIGSFSRYGGIKKLVQRLRARGARKPDNWRPF